MIRNTYNLVPHLIQDTLLESDKSIHMKAQRSALSQQVTTRLQDDISQIKTMKKIYKRSTTLERSVKILEGLN